jgi:hypothetical protein
MTTHLNGALGRYLASAALGGLIAFAFVSAAPAQWLPPPWRFAPPPGAIEQSLEAQGYRLAAPLTWRPGVYLADVSAGPAAHQRLVIDARTGMILERFIARGRAWGPTLAARDEGYGGSERSGPSGEFRDAPRPAPLAKSAYGGPGNVHIPAAISPYGPMEAPAGAKANPRSVSTDHKPPAPKAAAPTINPPLPPPAPREAARPEGLGVPASGPAEKHEQDQPKIDSRPTEVDNVPPPAATATPGSAEASDKPKVSIVPPALFE